MRRIAPCQLPGSLAATDAAIVVNGFRVHARASSEE
jgi:hypothetical protein